MTNHQNKNRKKVLITQSNYIPWKGYFDMIKTVDEFVVYDEMQYTRRDWRNRNKIKTNQGAKWLTIPVEVKGKYFQKINETKISDEKWSLKHLKSIQFNYSKSEYYKEYFPVIQKLYMEANYNLLTEINLHFIQKIMDLLNINTNITFSKNYTLSDHKTGKLVDICKKLNATDYYSGPAAKNYLDENLFEKENIKVHYFDFSDYPEYTQLHGGFDHYVSILDLIFNTGPNATNYMKSFE